MPFNGLLSVDKNYKFLMVCGDRDNWHSFDGLLSLR
jgi:hypothetical protein